jgi:hypothetical protein
MIRAEPVEHRVGRAARAHVVLGMDLVEADRAGGGGDVGEVFGLEAEAGCGGKGHGRLRSGGPGRDAVARPGAMGQAGGRSRGSSSSAPMRTVPSAPAGSSIVVQVPAATSVQALPW